MDDKKVEQQPKQESQEERNIRGIESEIWRLEQMMGQQKAKRDELLNMRAQMIADLPKAAVPKAVEAEEDTTTTK